MVGVTRIVTSHSPVLRVSKIRHQMTFTPISSALLVWCFAGVGATGEEKRSSLMVWKDGEYHKLCEGRVAADSKNQIKSDSLPAEPKGNVGKSIADHSATAPKSEPEGKEMTQPVSEGHCC